jgi:hypothetical protein
MTELSTSIGRINHVAVVPELPETLADGTSAASPAHPTGGSPHQCLRILHTIIAYNTGIAVQAIFCVQLEFNPLFTDIHNNQCCQLLACVLPDQLKKSAADEKIQPHTLEAVFVDVYKDS